MAICVAGVPAFSSTPLPKVAFPSQDFRPPFQTALDVRGGISRSSWMRIPCTERNTSEVRVKHPAGRASGPGAGAPQRWLGASGAGSPRLITLWTGTYLIVRREARAAPVGHQPMALSLRWGQHFSGHVNKGRRFSRMAVLAFLLGIGFLPLTGVLDGVFGFLTPPPGSDQAETRPNFFFCLVFTMPPAAAVLGIAARIQIDRNSERLRGQLLANLGIVAGLMNLVALGGIPGMLAARDRSFARRSLRAIHQAEERYRELYPEIGYSPDLRSLGPPESGAPPSANRAGLVSVDLAEGLSHQGHAPITYAPRAGADGVIAGYTVRIDSRVLWVLDDTGEIRALSRRSPPEGEGPRK